MDSCKSIRKVFKPVLICATNFFCIMCDNPGTRVIFHLKKMKGDLKKGPLQSGIRGRDLGKSPNTSSLFGVVPSSSLDCIQVQKKKLPFF